jgi:hypothetical protein
VTVTIVVTAGCEAVTEGGGGYGCLVVGGMAGNYAGYMVATPPDQQTLGGAVKAETVGGLEGAAGWGAGKLTGAVLGKLADTTGGRLIAKLTGKAGGKPEAAVAKAPPAGEDAAEAGSGAAPKAGAKGGAPHESPSEPAGSSGGGGCNSFVPGTKVLLAGGKTKNIEDVKVGDKVVATDPATGKTRLEPVIAAFGGIVYTNLVQITVDTDGKHGHHTGIITATEHHKFWDPAHHHWTRADHLTQGAALRTTSGAPVKVIRATYVPGHPTVRDLTIASLHTYYVEAGTTPVLVHNCGTGDISDKVMNKHILPRHSLELDHLHPEFSEKSKFVEGTTPGQIRQWARGAMRAPMDKISTGNGAHRHLFDVGEEIGFDGERHVAVWVENGQVTSVHPEFP